MIFCLSLPKKLPETPPTLCRSFGHPPQHPSAAETREPMCGGPSPPVLGYSPNPAPNALILAPAVPNPIPLWAHMPRVRPPAGPHPVPCLSFPMPLLCLPLLPPKKAGMSRGIPEMPPPGTALQGGPPMMPSPVVLVTSCPQHPPLCPPPPRFWCLGWRVAGGAPNLPSAVGQRVWRQS